jgi:three-Cys-motif partner protein
MNNRETKISQLEHSQAKVELYTKYLSIYLNVLHRAPTINHICIFDLFCGEGKYQNNCNGSSLGAVTTIKDHYFSNNQTCTDIDLLLNDCGQSEFENNKTKIQRNRELIANIFLPENVRVHYAEKDYSDILPETIKRLDALKTNERALVFIDPYGYKEIKATDLSAILKNRRTELLLFLPASFIYRFAESAFAKDFKGAEAIRTLLTGIFPNGIPRFSSCKDFILKIKDGLRKIVGTEYASQFIIQRDEINTYCLLFFTNSERGFEKMLATKWALDEDRGEGFRIDNGQTTLPPTILDNFGDKLLSFIRESDQRTNTELKKFGLICEYLPTHLLAILKELKKDGKIEAVDKFEAPVRSFYLDDKKRTVYIRKKG